MADFDAERKALTEQMSSLSCERDDLKADVQRLSVSEFERRWVTNFASVH